MPTSTELGPVIGNIETDTFCDGCGFNLYTQAVIRDERLGILICRCPECGRFSAAGRTNSAARVWLSRLGTILLSIWVILLLGLFALSALFLGLLAYGHMAEQTTMKPDAHAPNTYGYSFHYVMRDPSPDRDEEERHSIGMILLDCTAGVLAAVTGGLFSVLLWHCAGSRRAFALLPALLGSGFAALNWFADSSTVWIREWGLRQIIVFGLFEMAAAGVGVFLGRPIGRGMLKILAPPKVRQHLAFLWIVDGKTLPVAATISAKHAR